MTNDEPAIDMYQIRTGRLICIRYELADRFVPDTNQQIDAQDQSGVAKQQSSCISLLWRYLSLFTHTLCVSQRAGSGLIGDKLRPYTTTHLK